MDKALSKYLEQHAEQWIFPSLDSLMLESAYRHGIIIPCHAEGERIIATLESLPESDEPIVVIVIINGRASDADSVLELNRKTIQAIEDRYRLEQSADGLVRQYAFTHGTLLTYLCFEDEHALPDREGVGLARKIATDAALYLWTKGRIQSPYLLCSDADVYFPADLYEQLGSDAGRTSPSARLLPYWHQPEPDTPDVRHASALYEVSLRYYVLGLRYAGSPYAFHTIGSTIAVHALDYARARGFPKRLAAEDFYLLNKLHKIRPVQCTTGDPLRIAGRVSHRVPFGTGKAVDTILTRGDWPMYAPDTFGYLRELLLDIERAAITPETWLSAPGDAPLNPAYRCLQDLGYLDALSKRITGASNPAQARTRAHTYFDAFKTLKLVHQLRDTCCPEVPVFNALNDAPFITNLPDPLTDLDSIRAALMAAEMRTFEP